MFRGFVGCMILGGSLLAGALLGSLELMLAGAAAGLLIAVVSCELGAQEDKLLKKKVPYPTYKY